MSFLFEKVWYYGLKAYYIMQINSILPLTRIWIICLDRKNLQEKMGDC